MSIMGATMKRWTAITVLGAVLFGAASAGAEEPGGHVVTTPPPSSGTPAPALVAAPAPLPAGAFPGVPLAQGPTSASSPDRGPEPPSGLLWILGGAGLLALGVGNAAAAPGCYSVGNLKHPALCAGLSVGLGVAFLAAGIPLVVVGSRKRAAFLEWEHARGAPVVTAGPSSASLGWGWAW
jgi:hypothetical protein